MTYFTTFYLDSEKDMAVHLYQDQARLRYELETPNHRSGNLIRNFAKLCGLTVTAAENEIPSAAALPADADSAGAHSAPFAGGAETARAEARASRLVIRGEVPCYINADGEELFIFRLGDTKVANIFPDGRVEMKASVPSIAKTLMSQTTDYRLPVAKTIFKTYIPREVKFRADLHTHMNGNLTPDILIALGIRHQIRYPLYYVRKLGLHLTGRQEAALARQRERVARQFVNSGLTGKYLTRRINDNTFINFADLILRNLDNAAENIAKIRISLAILKDGQAVFTNLEKVYLYRYVFAKGKESEEKIPLTNVGQIPDPDIRASLRQMLRDAESADYHSNTIYQDCLLWIARSYRRQGIFYAEISDTTLVKKYESIQMLTEVHEVCPKIQHETGVMLRFLAALRRIPLTIIKDQVTPDNYLAQNLVVLQAVAADPYVAGCDFVGEELNDIITLKPLFKEIVRIARTDPDFVIRVHAGENDSLKDNVAHSIECVRDSLEKGQPMPHVRLGHGLYTYSLKSRKGQETLKLIRENDVVLEFQLSSNVRLNNLSGLENHPLRGYLAAGIRCVQGTDGAALYGTNAIDEQLSLEKLLGLTPDELRQMKRAETEIVDRGREAFARKELAFRQRTAASGMEFYLLNKMNESTAGERLKLHKSHRVDAGFALKGQIRELPWDRMPVVLIGGSFNSEKRATRVTEEGEREIKAVMAHLNPDDVFFVIGHRLGGYEKYLVEHNEKGFMIFAFVPAEITPEEKKRLVSAGVSIRPSTESEGTGIYKSINYEIFERRPSVVIAFDGNSAAANLIQEARNGKGKSDIFIWDRSAALRGKAESLEGYVHIFGDDAPLIPQLEKIPADPGRKL